MLRLENYKRMVKVKKIDFILASIDKSIVENDQDTFQRLFISVDHGLENYDIQRILDRLIDNSRINLIEWILPYIKDTNPIEYIIYYAALRGNNTIVIWMIETYPKECRVDLMDLVAGAGHLELLKLLALINLPCTTNAIDYAAMNGHLEIVKFLHINRTEGFVNAINNALVYGYTDILDFLKKVRKTK